MTHSADPFEDEDYDAYEALADFIADALVDTVHVRATLRGHMIASRLLRAGWSVTPPAATDP